MDLRYISDKKSEFIAYILLLITAIIWGGTWPLGRWLVSGESTIPPLMIAVIRYLLAIICLFIILKFKEKKLNWKFAKKNAKILCIMGFLSVTIYQSGYLLGEFFTAASDASIVVATNAIWVVILSSIFLKSENFTWRKLLGSFLAFLAVFIIFGFSPNLDVLNRILGDLLILIAALAYAIYTVISRYFLTKTTESSSGYQPSSIWIMTWVSLFGFIITTPIALIISPEYLNPLTYLYIPYRIWFGIFYLAFLSTVGAYTFYLEGIKRLNASRAAIFQTLVPLFGVLFSAIFLQEEFDFILYPIALFLVISGILLVNHKISQNKNLKNLSEMDNIDFEIINDREALKRMKTDFKFFIAALVKMKMVDNFDHNVPFGLRLFVDFFYTHHELIYQNQKNPHKVYNSFLKWLEEKNNMV